MDLKYHVEIRRRWFLFLMRGFFFLGTPVRHNETTLTFYSGMYKMLYMKK